MSEANMAKDYDQTLMTVAGVELHLQEALIYLGSVIPSCDSEESLDSAIYRIKAAIEQLGEVA